MKITSKAYYGGYWRLTLLSLARGKLDRSEVVVLIGSLGTKVCGTSIAPQLHACDSRLEERLCANARNLKSMPCLIRPLQLSNCLHTGRQLFKPPQS